jgi:hypothetical protein
MTITKRVSGTIAEDISKRISAAVSTDVTARVSGLIADGSSRRVDYFDGVADNISDPWNGSWGNSWGNSWRTVTVGFAGKPTIDVTERIGSAPSASITKRVTGV